MHPVAVEDAAVQSSRRSRRPPEGAEREGAVRSAVGIVRPGDVHAHVGEGRRGSLAPEGQFSVVGEEEVAVAFEADGSLAGGEQEAGVHLHRVPEADQFVGPGRVAAIHPDAVDIGHEDGRIAEQRVGFLESAAGLQQLGALVGNDDPGAASARCQMRLQPVGEPVDIDHRHFDARVGQPVQHVVDQGPPSDLDEGLGPVVGQGAHAGAEAGGEDHGCLRTGHARSSAGTCLSNQRATPSRPGLVRLAFRWAHMRGMKAA